MSLHWRHLMRKRFSQTLHDEMAVNENICLITADLGYGLWDRIRIDYPNRFFNVGSSEQLMIGMATGMAMEGKIPVVYSITSFLLYRPFEMIRNYLHHDKLPVKLIGGGRNKDYGYLGFTHWAEEDKKIMTVLDNIKIYHPEKESDLLASFPEIINNNSPCYLNLKRN